MHNLSYTQIQFQIPIPWLNIISISRRWPSSLLPKYIDRKKYLVNKWLIGNDPIQFPIQYMVSTIYMTSDISQSNSKSQYLRVPLYQYLQIKQHIGNDPIQFTIQYIDISTSLNICMTSDIPKSNSKSQYLGLSFYQYLQIK